LLSKKATGECCVVATFATLNSIFLVATIVCFGLQKHFIHRKKN
jgi:hypothetical protein